MDDAFSLVSLGRHNNGGPILFLRVQIHTPKLLVPFLHRHQPGHVAMILAVQHLVDLFQRPSFGFDPVVADKDQLQDVPAAVDHVRFPADGVEGEGKDPGDEEADGVDDDGVDAHADGAHRVVHDFGRVEDGEWGPADRVGALE